MNISPIGYTKYDIEFPKLSEAEIIHTISHHYPSYIRVMMLTIPENKESAVLKLLEEEKQLHRKNYEGFEELEKAKPI